MLHEKRKRDDSLQHGREGGGGCTDMVNGKLPGNRNKQAKVSANDCPIPQSPSPSPSPSNVTSLEGGSPSVNSKPLPKKHEAATIDAVKSTLPLSFDGESRIMERLKDLCSVKEPTAKVGIEMVGAAYLLDLTTSPCSETKRAVQDAVEAAKGMLRAEKLLSESQKMFKKVLNLQMHDRYA